MVVQTAPLQMCPQSRAIIQQFWSNCWWYRLLPCKCVQSNNVTLPSSARSITSHARFTPYLDSLLFSDISSCCCCYEKHCKKCECCPVEKRPQNASGCSLITFLIYTHPQTQNFLFKAETKLKKVKAFRKYTRCHGLCTLLEGLKLSQKISYRQVDR